MVAILKALNSGHMSISANVNIGFQIPDVRVKAGVFSQEEFSATSLFKLIFTLVSLSIIKILSLGDIELVKLFYTV